MKSARVDSKNTSKYEKSKQESFDEYCSSSDEEENVDSTSIIAKVTGSYNYSDNSDTNLSRFLYNLEQALQAGTLSCLICLSSVKRKDAVWSCVQCYTLFHLTCIHKWARDSIQRGSLDELVNAVAVVRPSKFDWNCPKCRFVYAEKEIPVKYVCYCGQEIDPPVQPWLLPHSCGSVCSKSLEPQCGHKCLLLCHPGGCPPCPRHVTRSCHCGRSPARSVRCFAGGWSCGQSCGKLLACKQHSCSRQCHTGSCPPCELVVEKKCVCAARSKKTVCGLEPWQCDKACELALKCGHHSCGLPCHAPGECRPCPLSGLTSCPCGAEKALVECPQPAPLCGNTCDKRLACGQHKCPQLCHRGECPPCMQDVEKSCACGMKRKRMPCSKEFRCQTKCVRRVCARHECGKRCCVECAPCDRVCAKPLNCARHKCASTCHLGPCYPCPVQNKVTCPCGGTFVMVNCGSKKVKTPVCNRPCKGTYQCSHGTQNKHRCHSGECPPCTFECDQILPCNHKCKARCHKSVKVTFKQVATPVTPLDIKAPKVQRMQLDCPPCTQLVELVCLGKHETMSQLCHVRVETCGRPCGRQLPCTNHYCTLECHDVDVTDCETCESDCAAARCRHGCPLARCHAGPCPPCEQLVKITCYCRLQQIFVECAQVAETLATCGADCINSMECGHRCVLSCHPGECSPSSECTKPVKVPCACNTVKAEVPCNVAKQTKTPCTEVCEKKRAAAAEAARLEEERKRQIEDEKNRRELEQYQRLFRKGKNQKKKRDVQIVEAPTSNTKLYIIAFVLVFFSAAFVYYFVSI